MFRATYDPLFNLKNCDALEFAGQRYPQFKYIFDDLIKNFKSFLIKYPNSLELSFNMFGGNHSFYIELINDPNLFYPGKIFTLCESGIASVYKEKNYNENTKQFTYMTMYAHVASPFKYTILGDYNTPSDFLKFHIISKSLKIYMTKTTLEWYNISNKKDLRL